MITRRSLAIGLGGVALARPAASQQPSPGGTVTLALASEPSTLVSLTTTAQPSVILSPKVTEGLLTYDFDLTPRPQLATAWSISPDGLRITFNLRPGVKWHDGQAFTSADVAFSLMLLKRLHPRGQSTLQNLTDVLTPDAATAILVLDKPAPYLLGALAAAESPIVAKHIYEPAGDRAAGAANETAPIGTGPFIFDQWVRGSYIVYRRNPNYWDPTKPYIDRLVARIVPDAASRSIGLETGEIDLVGWSTVPLTDVQRLAQMPTLAIDIHGNEYQNNLFYRIEFNTQNRFFQDIRVRQAVAHAIDRQAILKLVFLGYGVVANGPISPNLKAFYEPGTPNIAHDPAAAERLLDEAGFRRGADGIRFRVTQDAQTTDSTQIARYTRSALARIGIDVTVRTEDLSAYIKRIYTTRAFDFNAQGSTQMFDPTIGTQRFYWSKNFRPGVPYSNGAAYANPMVDRDLEAAAGEIDPQQRRAYFAEFQKIVATEVPAIGLVAQSQITVANKRVHNHTTTADGISANFADIYIKA